MNTQENPPSPRPQFPKRRGRRLASVVNVRAALADVVRKLEAKELDPNRGNALTGALKALGATIQASDFESRLAALERQLAAGGADRGGFAS